MIASVSATLITIGKKILKFLLTTKKGRKFLGYVIGILLLIVFLPVLVVYGLFGWMAGGGAEEIIQYEEVYNNLPTEIREQIESNSSQMETIEKVFEKNGISEDETKKAKLLYMSFLTEHSDEETFYVTERS